MKDETSPFVLSLVGMAVSASVLIVLVPSLFRSGEQGSVWAVGMSASLTAVFAVGMRCWRPPVQHGRKLNRWLHRTAGREPVPAGHGAAQGKEEARGFADE